MRLSEYSDEDLLEEVRHRGLKIELIKEPEDPKHFSALEVVAIKIGGVTFDIKP